MATLEVHDGQGRVQFVELARDHPVLFGTSTTCDVRLDGDRIRPVHGRIRWKKRRFRVEASPDAEFVLINGAKMSTGSIRQGDEIAVGDCRIFLLRDDGDPDDGESPPARRGRRRKDESADCPQRSHRNRKGWGPAPWPRNISLEDARRVGSRE